MKYRPLGRTGLLVSEIGFGAWGIGGRTVGQTSYGEIDDRVSLRHSTARWTSASTSSTRRTSYGDGHSEALLGQAFGKRRDRSLSPPRRDAAITTPKPTARPISAGRLKEALRRLRTDYVDVVQVHSPSSMEALKQTEVMATLDRLKDEGKIRAVGISVKAPAEGVPAISELGAEVIQVNFNLVDQRASEGDVLVVAAQHGVGCYRPNSALLRHAVGQGRAGNGL